MRSFFTWSLLAAASLLPSTFAVPLRRQAIGVPVQPGDVSDIIISESNTLNGTFPGNKPPQMHPFAAEPDLRVDLVNTLGGAVNAYIAAQDPQGRVMFLLANGNWFYPTASDPNVPQAIPQNLAIPLGPEGSTTSLRLPGFFSSGRIFFAAGQLQFYTLRDASNGAAKLVMPDPLNPRDPSAGVFWGFAEMTYSAQGGLYANLSFVDFVGLPVGQRLTTTDGAPPQIVLGLARDAARQVCNAMVSRARQDNQPWDQLCQTDANGNILRVDAPGKYIAAHGGGFDNYWTSYVDQVWARFASEPLIINSQNHLGDMRCSTTSGQIVCPGGSRSFAKPSALDIFGCQGVFGRQDGDNDVILAATPRICAALQRSTLLLEGGQRQPQLPVGRYYLNSPTNWYAKATHDAELDGRGYAFAYDDVNPDGAPDASGAVVSPNADVWTLFVGGSR